MVSEPVIGRAGEDWRTTYIGMFTDGLTTLDESELVLSERLDKDCGLDSCLKIVGCCKEDAVEYTDADLFSALGVLLANPNTSLDKNRVL